MPRDLEAERKEAVEDMPELTKEHALNTEAGGDTPVREMPTQSPRDSLHPYTQILGLTYLESCVKLEEAAFPPNEACSREKILYRLTKCGELTLGIMTSAPPGADMYDAPTARDGPPTALPNPDRREVLLGHILATKTNNATVTDRDMALPDDWRSSTVDSTIGHNEAGRTLALHSLGVLPDVQRRGLGKTLLRAYVERIESSGVADRIALLAHEPFIAFYESLGFTNHGKSDAQYGGGGWFDMVLDFKAQHAPPEDIPKPEDVPKPVPAPQGDTPDKLAGESDGKIVPASDGPAS